MKKLISSLLMVVVLFNFIFCQKSYAYEGTSSIDPSVTTPSDAEQLLEEGTANVKNDGSGGENDISEDVQINFDVMGGKIFGTITGILARALNIFPMMIQALMMYVTNESDFFTIEKIVFNEITLFNINYFNFSASPITQPLKESVSGWYYILRLISIAISLLILLYVGIRMALSTLSADKAKYKKMLMSWLESIVILFLMQYIISILFNLGEMFGNIVCDLRDTLKGTSFELDTLEKICDYMNNVTGWEYTAYSIVYWFLVFIQIKFFYLYFKRLIVVGFLVLIAPLVTITYPIDKIGDGKAQAFTVWLSELSVNIIIQPIHALIYLIFIYTAGDIAKYSIFVALFFLLALTKVEKTILHLFNLRNVVSLKPVDENKK